MKPDEAHALYTWLTVANVAHELNVSQEYVRELIRKGTLPASRFGHYRIRPEDLDAFKEQRRVRSA